MKHTSGQTMCVRTVTIYVYGYAESAQYDIHLDLTRRSISHDDEVTYLPHHHTTAETEAMAMAVAAAAADNGFTVVPVPRHPKKQLSHQLEKEAGDDSSNNDDDDVNDPFEYDRL